jgi:hypothetical protein
VLAGAVAQGDGGALDIGEAIWLAIARFQTRS